MPDMTKEELQARSLLVHTHEANCKIEHPTDDERNFRIAIMKRLAETFGLRILKDKTIAGPVKPGSPFVPQPKAGR
jgi:hypothetical protein